MLQVLPWRCSICNKVYTRHPIGYRLQLRMPDEDYIICDDCYPAAIKAIVNTLNQLSETKKEILKGRKREVWIL